MKAIDLFSGLGGWSTGAVMAGCEVLWAANHWQEAVHWHSENHPGTHHVCQDLHQADWTQVPSHDLLLASPCCQGHSKARGKASGNPQHDASRSTAWAVVSAIEFHRPQAAIVENVPEFLEWPLYPAWAAAMQALGYALAPHVVNCADLGVPQERIRMFIVCTRSANPLTLNLPKLEHVPAAQFIDFTAGRWSPIAKLGSVLKMLVFCPPIVPASNEGRKPASLIKVAKLTASFSYLVENRRNFFFSHPKHRSTTFRLR